MTSIKVRSCPFSPHQRTRSCISSSLTPFSATQLIFILRPAAVAASIPSITLSNFPHRVMARNFSGYSVSSETLTRRTPQAASCSAYLASWLPFVVSVSSSKAPESKCRPSRSNSHMMFRRTSGSPPVMRSLRTPFATNTEQRRSSSSRVRRSAFGKKVMSSDMQ